MAAARRLNSVVGRNHTVPFASVEPIHVVLTLAVGLGATLVMDLWGIFLRRAFNTPFPNYCLVGRWLCYMPEGIFRHGSIAATPPKAAECAVGWIAHYATGVAYAVVLVLCASTGWLLKPTLLPAMVLGLVTVAIPFLVMQPSFGMGVAGSQTPNPAQVRLRSLMNHAVFGLGLYISALAAAALFKAHA